MSTTEDTNAARRGSESNDQLGVSEYEAGVIARMKARADAFGLWVEVKDAYDGYRTCGDTPDEAAWCAMYDWDL